MALTDSGRSALTALLTHEGLFPRVKDKDLAAAAVKLASKQVTAAGLGRDDLLAIKSAIGEAVFETTLESLSPYHIKLLARRLDKTAPEIEVNTGSSALAFVRKLLSADAAATSANTPPPAPAAEDAADAAPKKNKYLGRKAFRTGR
ncbi:MAG: hypothetical protein AAFR82_02890 [Pseudomonadota bacterium]